MENKHLKILFLYPNLHMSTLLPNGIAILSAALKQNGFKNIQLFDPTFYQAPEQTRGKKKERSRYEAREKMGQVRAFDYADRGIELKKSDMFSDFVAKVDSFKPDIIVASILEDTWPIFLKFMDLIKDKKIKCLAGGVFPSSVPEKVLEENCVDYVCRGEGEGALVDLCNAIEFGKDPSNIANLYVKKDGKIVAKNRIRPALDVNTLPVQDLSIFEDVSLHRPMMGKIYRMVPVETQRGCPYACRFCNSPEKNEFYDMEKAGRYLRKRTMKHVHTELKEIISKFGIEYIFFIADTFLAMSEREFDEFCEMYAEFKLPFYMHTRPETITERRAKKLAAVGCHKVNIGVEHGNQKFRTEIVGRNYNNEIAIKSFELMWNAGISTTSNNILGFPDETRDLIFDTIELVRKLKSDDINAFTFIPYQGTSLRTMCEEKKYLDKKTLANIYETDSLLDMPSISKKEIGGLVKTFPLYTRLPRSYWKDIKIAEQDTPEGIKIFQDLISIFRNQYSNAALARD